MEKSQQELKRTKLRKRRFKSLAEIAVVYHDISKSLLLHKKTVSGKKQRKAICEQQQRFCNKNIYVVSLGILFLQKKGKWNVAMLLKSIGPSEDANEMALTKALAFTCSHNKSRCGTATKTASKTNFMLIFGCLAPEEKIGGVSF